MKARYLFHLGIFWLILGVFLAAPSLISYFKITPAMATVAVVTPDTSVIKNTDEPLISGKPSHITFPSYGIDKEILPGTFNATDGTWTLSDYGAQYATVTPEPNNRTGNTFIYGHNNQRVFGKLLSASVGLEAIITTENNHTFRYKLVTIADVKPEDTSMLAPHNAPILTVQTCSGLWSENRRMFVFELTEAK